MTQQLATSLERLASESCVGVLLWNDSTRLRHAVTSRGVWGQTAKYVIDKHPRLCFANLSKGVSLTLPVPQREKGGFADAATRASSSGVKESCLAESLQLVWHIPVSECGRQMGFPSSPKTFLRMRFVGSDAQQNLLPGDLQTAEALRACHAAFSLRFKVRLCALEFLSALLAGAGGVALGEGRGVVAAAGDPLPFPELAALGLAILKSKGGSSVKLDKRPMHAAQTISPQSDGCTLDLR
jgi:hypothetical protein